MQMRSIVLTWPGGFKSAPTAILKVRRRWQLHFTIDKSDFATLVALDLNAQLDNNQTAIFPL